MRVTIVLLWLLDCSSVIIVVNNDMRFELVSELLEKVGVHGELVIQLGIDHVSKAIRVRWSYSIPRSSDTTRYASPSIVNRTSTHH